MISYEDALNRIAAELEPEPGGVSTAGEAIDAATGDTVSSRFNVPAFDNAAMDGIAVRSADVTAADTGRPVELTLVGTVAAGQWPERAVGEGEAIEIMTGAPLPAGADAVIPVERIEIRAAGDSGRRARVDAAVPPGLNVRRAGEDFAEGQVLTAAGARVTPELIMNLAAAGIDSLAIRPCPGVAVLTTGNELRGRGQALANGKIRDANGPYLAAAVPLLGGRLVTQGNCADDIDALCGGLHGAAARARVVVSTGGVSAGRFDAIPAAIERLGGEILFHKVAIRPGKPVLFARLPGGSWLFGLPGNPVAVAACLRFFVAPALRRLRGLPDEQLLPAVARHDIGKRAGLRFFGKARAHISKTGQLEVRLLRGQESFRILPLLQANCWAVVDEGRERIASGELIRIAPLYPTSFLQVAGS